MFRFLQQVMEKENSAPDGVLVSDVGKPLVIQSDNRAGGLVRTTMRSSDILMDRVGQLENETFQDAPGFVFTRITDVVDPSGDPTALHPEVQRQAAYIRTDLDRFSDLEVSSLIRHGYCVGRKVAQAHPELFGDELPASPPWDPTPEARAEASAVAMASSLPGSNRKPTAVTREARALQGSALRRIWSTLLDYRDWTSYVYVPILVPLLVLTPYFVFKSYQRSHRVNQLVESLAQGGRDVEIMSKLLEGPVRSIVGERPEEIPNSAIVDSKGFLILQDSLVIDLRGWKPAPGGRTEEGSLVYGYRRLRVLKEPENKGNNHFVTKVLASSPESVVHFPQQELKPKLSVRHLEDSQTGLKQALCEVHVDFQKVPPGEPIDVIYEHISPGEFLRQGTGATTLAFDVDADTAELIRWLLLPEDKQYQKWRMIRYPQGNPAAAESVRVVTEFLAEDSTILAFKLLSLKGGYTYEITWIYR